MSRSIGVIGNGYVGGAVAAFFREKARQCLVYDTNRERSGCTLSDVTQCPVIFVCVPTPTTEYGQQSLAAVHQALISIPVTTEMVVLKSTVLPGTSRKLAVQYNHNLVFSPEFLSARTAEEDFASPTSIILGTGAPQPSTAAFFQETWPDVPILEMTWEEAELVKYARNTFYAAKVAWWNEMYELCDALGVPYDRVKEGALAGGWINPMHTKVPGPDGMFGFGGACLPKDSEALLEFAFANGVDLSLLRQALKSNKKLRRPAT